GWYDAQGQSAVRTLMRTPINGARISSGFGMRRHPTKGYNAMHRGVDFAVPKGTPILAAGSGHIDMAGWNGSYGKYIRIRHNSTYDTAYAHLSGFAAGIRRGTAIEQGQVIGYVGSTGRSTGPHLHYEIMVNNRKVNPLTVKLPTGKSVPETEMAAFRQQIKLIESQLSGSDTPQYAGISFSSPVF
ncbi:MAG: M23 family metallopeptidase, partial [Candidatus Puniceispirillaceae bacterium]